MGKATEAHIASLAEVAATGEIAPASGVPKAKKAMEAATDHLDALLGPGSDAVDRARPCARVGARSIRGVLTGVVGEQMPAAWDAKLPYEQSRQPLKEAKRASADWLRERWKNGQSAAAISRALERKNKTGVERIVVVHGGIVPAPRQRALAALRLEEREEISRGIAVGLPIRQIAQRLRRAPSQ